MFNLTTGQKTRQQKEEMQPEAKSRAQAPMAKEVDPRMEQRVDEIEKQRIEFSRKNPEFDMKEELKNPEFVEYIWVKGLTVEEAYFLVHRQEIIDQACQNAIAEMSQRRERIQENGAGKNHPAIAKKNPKDLSDKEIDDIIERVRQGEKVSF